MKVILNSVNKIPEEYGYASKMVWESPKDFYGVEKGILIGEVADINGNLTVMNNYMLDTLENRDEILLDIIQSGKYVLINKQSLIQTDNCVLLGFKVYFPYIVENHDFFKNETEIIDFDNNENKNIKTEIQLRHKDLYRYIYVNRIFKNKNEINLITILNDFVRNIRNENFKIYYEKLGFSFDEDRIFISMYDKSGEDCFTEITDINEMIVSSRIIDISEVDIKMDVNDETNEK